MYIKIQTKNKECCCLSVNQACLDFRNFVLGLLRKTLFLRLNVIHFLHKISLLLNILYVSCFLLTTTDGVNKI